MCSQGAEGPLRVPVSVAVDLSAEDVIWNERVESGKESEWETQGGQTMKVVTAEESYEVLERRDREILARDL